MAIGVEACHNKDRCSCRMEGKRGGTLENQFSSNFCKTTPYEEEVVVKHSRAWSSLKGFFPFWSIHKLGFPTLHRCQETWIIRHIPTFTQIFERKKKKKNPARSMDNEIRIWPCSLTLPVKTLASFSKSTQLRALTYFQE